MSRTHIIATERNATWPLESTRDRLHAFFKTSDEDLVEAGVARRVVYEVPGRPPQVTYEPTVRRGDPPPATEVAPTLEAVPASTAKMLAEIQWDQESRVSVESLLEGILSRQRRLSDEAAAAPDTPRPVPPQAAERT